MDTILEATGAVTKLALALGLATVAYSWASGAAGLEPAASTATARARHVLLEHTSPAAGDTLGVVPAELVLTFSGPLERAGAVLRLVGPAGRIWTLDEIRRPDDPRALVGTLPPLDPGEYRVEWRVISGDGHPVAGDFVFYVSGGEGAVLAPPTPPAGASEDERVGANGDRPGSSADGAGATTRVIHLSWRLSGVRAGADLALLLLAGTLLFAAWGTSGPTRRTASTTDVLAVAAPLLTIAYAWIWSGEVLGAGIGAGSPPEGAGFSARLDALTVLSTGRSFMLESGLAMLTAWALLLARRPRVASVLAVLTVLAGGLAGHAASYTPALSIPANAAHQLAAAAWAGGLLFLVTEAGAVGFVSSVARVSGIALVAAAVVAVTGLLQGWLLLGSAGALLATSYGLLVLGKVAGFGGLIGFGAYHRYRMLPRLSVSQGPHGYPRTVGAELALAAVVVILAAVLSHIPPNP